MENPSNLTAGGNQATAGVAPIATFTAPIVMFSGTHADHGLLPQHWGWIMDVAGMHLAECGDLKPLIRTVKLPPGCPDVENGLYGPACGDAPVGDIEVTLERRGDRPWADRLVDRPKRPSRLLTVVAVPEFRDVPEKGRRLVCFTAYGGPAAPQNPEDPSNRDPEGARAFWAEHALAR